VAIVAREVPPRSGRFQTILGGSTKAKGGSRKARNTSDTVDMVTERLIELLTTLETETAIAAVAAIVRRFGDANWLPAAERKKAARSRRRGRAVVPCLCFWRWPLLLQQHVHAHGKTQYDGEKLT